MRYLILLIFPVFALLGTESTLTLQIEYVLEDFFQVLCMESEGGYVLFGKKPVCINGFHDHFGGPCNSHRISVCLREGARLWGQNESNLIIHTYDQPDSLVKGCTHILMINKDLFHKTVQDNLTLFQYVLGPNLTPETLLAELTNPKQTFHNVLKEDKVLIGILLGFGTENSLHASRLENLQDAYVNSAENVPYKNQLHTLDNILGHYKYVFLNHLQKKGKVAKLQPSFSYKSFEEEITDAREKIEPISGKLSENKPCFIFGKLKNSSTALIADLERTQDEIIALMSKKDFLKNILKMMEKEVSFETETISAPELLLAVSSNLYDSIKDENEMYFEGFLKGLQGNKDPNIKPFGHYDKLKVLKVAKRNVDEADLLFSGSEKGVIYKTTKHGTGKFLNDQGVVVANYKIRTPTGEVLKEAQEEQIDLKDTIPGFAWGMKGMQEGETRELVIHPSAAYGLYTNLEKGIHLFATVELLSIESPGIPFTPIEYLDFSAPFNFLAQSNFDEISKNEGYLHGLEVGSHFKKQNFFTLEKLIEAIQQKPEYQASSDLVNKLHWHIYRQNPNLSL